MPRSSDALPSEEEGDRRGKGEGPPRRLRRRVLLAGAVVVAGFTVLGFWTRAVSSTSLCAKCHAMDSSIDTAAKSVHHDVSCIECHGGAGATAALRYLPTLAREGVQEATGWHWAGGVLAAKTCTSCHKSVRTKVSGDFAESGSGSRATVHPDPKSNCAECHGEVAHPGRAVPAKKGHPHNYQQTHGRDVATLGRESCARCHETSFCRSCHATAPPQHPAGWKLTHGKVKEAEGRSCTLCHSPSTFCKECHGTEIPHRPDWLKSHPVEAAEVNVSLCRTCHTQAACDGCHEKHAAHRSTVGGVRP